MSSPPSETMLFFGRFHPLLVHLPIGLILLDAALELLARWPRFRHANATNGLILALAGPAAAGSALCGWLLSQGGGYDAHILGWHKWSGFAVAVASLLALALHRLDFKIAYRAVLLVTAVLLTVASHFGGSLTHGSDYLTRYAPPSLRRFLGTQPPAQSADATGTNQSLFASAILPVLQRHCVECHGPEKSKAGLRCDTLVALLKGSQNGPILQPGQSAASPIMKRLRLPASDEDHMPPEGKPQPSADQIALLQWWIDAGAPGDKSMAQLNPPAILQHLFQTSPASAPTPVPAPAAPAAPKPASEVLPLARQISEQLGIAITPLSQTEPWLQCSASMVRTNFGDTELAKLAPLALNLRWLDLGGTGVTDTGLVQIAAMKHLTKLHLERTVISDEGLVQLAGLGELEYLNLYGAPVRDEGLAHLKSLSKLRQLYLWQTKVSSNAARSFADQFVDKDQIKRWQDEIAALTAKLKNQGLAVDVGIPLISANATNSTNSTTAAVLKPINTKCPITDKDIDPSKTSLYEGKLVAFCCDKCKAAFDKDPKACLPKLGLAASAPESNKPKAP